MQSSYRNPWLVELCWKELSSKAAKLRGLQQNGQFFIEIGQLLIQAWISLLSRQHYAINLRTVCLISYFKRNFTIKQFAADCSHSWLVLWVDSVFLLNSIIKCPIQNVTYKNFCTIWVRNRLWYQTVNSIPSWWFIHISPSHIFCKIMVPSELKKLWPTLLSPSDVTYK